MSEFIEFLDADFYFDPRKIPTSMIENGEWRKYKVESKTHKEYYTPSKEVEKRIRYMAWCYDMHNLLSCFLDWIWERIK